MANADVDRRLEELRENVKELVKVSTATQISIGKIEERIDLGMGKLEQVFNIHEDRLREQHIRLQELEKRVPEDLPDQLKDISVDVATLKTNVGRWQVFQASLTGAVGALITAGMAIWKQLSP